MLASSTVKFYAIESQISNHSRKLLKLCSFAHFSYGSDKKARDCVLSLESAPITKVCWKAYRKSMPNVRKYLHVESYFRLCHDLDSSAALFRDEELIGIWHRKDQRFSHRSAVDTQRYVIRFSYLRRHKRDFHSRRTDVRWLRPCRFHPWTVDHIRTWLPSCLDNSSVVCLQSRTVRLTSILHKQI